MKSHSLYNFLKSQWRAPEDTVGTRTEVTASAYRHTQLEAKRTFTLLVGGLLTVLESRSYTVSAWQIFPDRALIDRTNYFISVNSASAKYEAPALYP